MMVDFLTVEMPDPLGVAITGGEVLKIGTDGVVEWATQCKLAVKGSWDSQLQVRNVLDVETADYDDTGEATLPGRVSGGALSGRTSDGGLDFVPGVVEGRTRQRGLELSGNPAKFVQGHNLFGSDDPAAVLSAAVRKVGLAMGVDLSDGIDPEAVAQARISRIDLTGSWVLDREGDVLPFLRSMEERVWVPYRGRGVQSHPGTLYYGYAAKGKRAKDWQLKLYSKGLEVAHRPLPGFAMQVPGLLDEVNRTIRVELTLRTPELKRLGLRRVGDWTPEKVGEVWRSYVDRLDFGDAKMSLDVTDLAALGIKPRLIDTICAWKAGNDMRAGRSLATFKRLRKEIRDATGYDIASPMPKSNVVPLRRVIEARPALYPVWADQLTAALEQAA